MSLETSRTHRVDHSIELLEDGHTLALSFINNANARSTGVTVLGVGVGLGVASFALGLIGLAIQMPDSAQIAFFSIGGVTTFLSLLVGLGFACQGDAVSIELDPDGAIRF